MHVGPQQAEHWPAWLQTALLQSKRPRQFAGVVADGGQARGGAVHLDHAQQGRSGIGECDDLRNHTPWRAAPEANERGIATEKVYQSRSQAGSQGGGSSTDIDAASGNPSRLGAASRQGAATAQGGGINDETRMMTSTTPLARVKARATGVLGQLRRMLSERVAGFDIQQGATGRPSPGLVEAVSLHATQVQQRRWPHLAL